MTNKEKFKIVKKHIDKMDPYNSLAEGAPKNEFDLESKKISELISSEKSEIEIAETIANVFNMAFSENLAAETYLKEAKRIKCELTCD